jgi:hypothetical protein
VRNLLGAGLSKRAAAAKLGVSETTLYRSLRGGAWETRRGRDTETRGREGAAKRRSGAEEGKDEDDGYPEALLRRVPRDFTPILPPAHFWALVRAAASSSSAAAVESLRQALMLHAEPMVPPPTRIELVLGEEEEEEWRTAGEPVGST